MVDRFTTGARLLIEPQLGPQDILGANLNRILESYNGDVGRAVAEGLINERYAIEHLAYTPDWLAKQIEAERAALAEELEARLDRLWGGRFPDLVKEKSGISEAARVPSTPCWAKSGKNSNGQTVFVATGGEIHVSQGINNSIRNQGPGYTWCL